MTDWVDRIARPTDDFDAEIDDDTDTGVVVSPVDPGAESVVDEFVDFFNARDLDGIGALLAEDIEAEFIHEIGSAAALDGLEHLFVRQPFAILTRGEIGTEPIAGVWRPDEDGHVGIGYLVFEFTEEDEPLIHRIEYVEELEGDDLSVEEPDEVEEGLDWDIADLDR